MAQVVPAQTVPIPATVPGISKETGEEHRPSSELEEKRESKNLEATEPDSRGSKEVGLERQPASSTHSSQEKAQLERTATNASHRGNKWTWALTCAGLFLSAFLYGLDTTIAADVQGSVYIRFGDIEKLAWVGIGFPMGSVAIILLVGMFYGMFNAKWLFIISMALFEGGSALCGGAPTIDALIIGRVIAGMGGCGIYLGALTYVASYTTVRERPLYNASMGLTWGVGAILGPVIGGAFSVNESTTWRWAFYINLPLAGALVPVYFLCFPDLQPMPGVPFFEKLKKVDWVGAILNACLWVFFIVALTFSGSTWAWKSGGAISMWVLFGVSLIAFIVQQAFAIFTTKEFRLFPVHLLKSRTWLSLYFATAASTTNQGILIYYIPLLFQFSKGDSALKAAVRLLPFMIPTVFAMMFNGALLPVTKMYAPWYLVSGVLMLIGSALLFKIDSSTGTGAIYGFEVLTALGGGATFQICYSIAATKLKGMDIPLGIGYFNVAQIGTFAICLGMAGSVFQNIGFSNLKSALVGENVPDEVLRGALAGAVSLNSDVFTPEQKQLVIDAVVKTIASDFGLVIAAGAVMIVASAVMRWERLNMDPTAADG